MAYRILSKSSVVILTGIVCASLAATDAFAQHRGGGGGQGRSGGGARSSGGGVRTGGAVVRGSGSRGVVVGGARGSGRVVVGSPYYRSGYYGSGYRSGYYRPGFSIGLYAGYPFYGYPYGYYGSPYGYYGAYYGGYYGYGYPPYAYGGDAYGSSGYGGAYGSVRIQGAPGNAEVFADGYYVGIVDDFDGSFQHLDLRAGPHAIEVRAPGAPPVAFDVNVQPGRTTTFHAGPR